MLKKLVVVKKNTGMQTETWAKAEIPAFSTNMSVPLKV